MSLLSPYTLIMETAIVMNSRNLTVDEVVGEIEALTDHDCLKIVNSGRAWTVGLRGFGSEDLFHEALTRLLEDARHIPSQINFTYGVLKIMQSLADERRKQQVRYWIDNDDEQPDSQIDEDSLEELVQEESLAALQTRVGNDNTAADVLGLRAQGYTAEEICTMLSIKRTTYDSARKRIRRAVLKDMEERDNE